MTPDELVHYVTINKNNIECISISFASGEDEYIEVTE